MSTLNAIFLGIVQGLTEFLPVSSSGHLAVFQQFLGEVEESLSFDIAVHIGTALSVIVVYREVLLKILKDFISSLRSRELNGGTQLVALIVLGTLPAGLVGVLFKSQFEAMFSNLSVVTAGFGFTAMVLFLSRNSGSGGLGEGFLKFSGAIEIRWWQALLVGTAQALAIVPGISRSGTTIACGLICGLDRRHSAMFSFMLAIPAIFGAALLQVIDLRAQLEYSTLLLGVFVSFVVGLAALKMVLAFVKDGRMHYFSYYLLTLVVFLGIYHIRG